MCVTWEEGDDYAEGYAARQAHQGRFHVTNRHSEFRRPSTDIYPRRMDAIEGRRGGGIVSSGEFVREEGGGRREEVISFSFV